MFTALGRDVVNAVRTLAKNTGFTVVGVLAVALAIVVMWVSSKESLPQTPSACSRS